MAAAETSNTNPPQPQYDPVALTQCFATAADKSAKLLGDFVARQATSGNALANDEFGLSKAFLELAAKMLSNPYRLAEAQFNLFWEYSVLWQTSLMKLVGRPTSPVAQPAKSDKRFRHEDWEEHFLFDYVKQSYLITARWLHSAVAKTSTMPTIPIRSGCRRSTMGPRQRKTAICTMSRMAITLP